VEDLICELTGAQSAIAVNNNAGAVLLALNTIAQDTQVIVSRGELVEIGGSFRVPDVMAKSGCILKEVGTTNRTHPKDYENAISEETGLLLKVHASNYTIEGFTASVALNDLVKLGNSRNIPVMEDLGSGTFIDFSNYNLPAEPTVSDSVKTGADVVTFSGDKLLGGPQAGIIVGQTAVIDQIKANPLTRALRIDKLTLAALESTLKIYRDEDRAVREIPTLRMLTMPFEDIRKKAELLFNTIKQDIGSLAQVDLADMSSRPGGGSFPELRLPTRCVTIQPEHLSVSRLENRMRFSSPAIIGRIEDNRYIMDPRTIQNGQESIISSTLTRILKNHDH
jgi:L-seryl-tRNA(Ser) seleniumtransferase